MLKVHKPTGIQKLRLKLAGLCSEVGRKVGLQQTQLVVCGFPRSGTSLLYNMLSSTLREFKFEPFEKYFIHRIHKLGNIATKAPMDVMHLDHLDALNVNGKNLAVLLVVRDIRDVITSVHPIYNDEYFIGYDYSWWPQDKELKQWRYDAPGVMDIHRSIVEFSKRRDCLIVRYEDLVKNPNKEQRKIQKNFGFQFSGDFSDYHSSPERHAYRYEGKFEASDASLVRENSEVTDNRVARWLKDDSSINRVVSQFRDCEELHQVLECYGYESNKDWFYELIDKNPETTSSGVKL